MPSLKPLLPFLTSGADLGVWPDCWVSAEYLQAQSLGRNQVAPLPPPPKPVVRRVSNFACWFGVQ